MCYFLSGEKGKGRGMGEGGQRKGNEKRVGERKRGRGRGGQRKGNEKREW